MTFLSNRVKIFLFDFISEEKILPFSWICSRKRVAAYYELKTVAENSIHAEALSKSSMGICIVSLKRELLSPTGNSLEGKGKCFACETKTAPTPTLQTPSLLSGPQYCHGAPCVFFANGLVPSVSSMAISPSLVGVVVLCF